MNQIYNKIEIELEILYNFDSEKTTERIFRYYFSAA